MPVIVNYLDYIYSSYPKQNTRLFSNNSTFMENTKNGETKQNKTKKRFDLLPKALVFMLTERRVHSLYTHVFSKNVVLRQSLVTLQGKNETTKPEQSLTKHTHNNSPQWSQIPLLLPETTTVSPSIFIIPAKI